jgi:hypothetical protein
MPGWCIHVDVARKAIDALETNPRAAGIFAAGGPIANERDQSTGRHRPPPGERACSLARVDTARGDAWFPD